MFPYRVLPDTAYKLPNIVVVTLIHHLPCRYDKDGNSAAFSASEMSDIVAVWRAVAEDYAPFDVDITTIQPASLSNTAMQYISHVCIGGDGSGPGFTSSGGVAYVGVFGLSNNYYYQPAFVFPKNLGGEQQQLLRGCACHDA
jgi:hypothetical protein